MGPTLSCYYAAAGKYHNFFICIDMALGQPKFEAVPVPAEHPEELEKKSADIIPFPVRAQETEGTLEQGQEAWTPGAVLSRKQYQEVLKCVAEGDERTRERHAADQASYMAQVGEIPLSPEAVAVYGVLRSGKPGEEKEKYRSLSDQELFAEALLISGETTSRETFMAKHPNIFH